jgi:hypothetical protein
VGILPFHFLLPLISDFQHQPSFESWRAGIKLDCGRQRSNLSGYRLPDTPFLYSQRKKKISVGWSERSETQQYQDFRVLGFTKAAPHLCSTLEGKQAITQPTSKLIKSLSNKGFRFLSHEIEPRGY